MYKAIRLSRLLFAFTMAGALAIVSCSGNHASLPVTTDSSALQRSSNIKFVLVAHPTPTPGGKELRRLGVIRDDSSPFPSAWNNDTDDVCQSNGYQCGSPGESPGEAWGYGDTDPKCGPVTWTISNVTPSSGVVAALEPASGIANSPPYSMGEEITVSGTHPPNPIYGTYTMTATSAVCGVETGQGGYYVLCGYSVGNCPIAQITDEDLSKIVSATSPPQSPTPWVVGVHKTVMVAATGGTDGPYTTKMLQWQLPTGIAANYSFGTSPPQVAPSPVPSSAAQQAKLAYYWISGNNTTPQNFQAQMELTSTNEEAVPVAYVSYLVETPTSISVTDPLNPVVIGPFYPNPGPSPTPFLSMGTLINVPTSAGIFVTLKATMPSISQGSGYIGLSQIVTAGSTLPTAPPFADGCAIQDNALESGVVTNVGPTYVKNGASGTASFFDAPNVNLITGGPSPLTDADTFVDYLMYRPAGTNSIWVALEA